ncbi:MAG: PHB depolymerase family esterase [Xanthomonadales bacterium]|nr:PHB depolymerase family esterase [Xanthomonadales bacterium]
MFAQDCSLRRRLLWLLLLGVGSAQAQLSIGLSMDHDGEARQYDLYDPGGGQPVPLVLDLHGFGSNTSEQRAASGMSTIAANEGFAVAFPQGMGGWNAFVGRGGIDDVGFLLAVVEDVSSRRAIDPSRVYVTGISNGGEMAVRLACEAAEVFAAFAPVAGAIRAASAEACDPTRPIAFLGIRGVTDTIIPYGSAGVRSGPFLSAPDSLEYWRSKNVCTGPVEIVELGRDSFCQLDTHCEAGTEATLCTVQSTSMDGHILYDNTDHLELSRLIWEFLKVHSLPETDQGFAINAGLTGAWYDAATPGQGFLVEAVPDGQSLFVAWFTYDELQAKVGDPAHRWFTLQGNYDGDRAALQILESSGGAFNAAQDVATRPVGSATLLFHDCATATLEYAFDGGPAGSLSITRLTPDTLCASELGETQ